MFRDIKRGFSYSVGRLLFKVGLFFIILVLMFMISSCHVHAETIDMVAPNRSLEIYVNSSQVINTSLPTVTWGGVTGKNIGGVNILNFVNNVNNPLQQLYSFYDNINSSNTLIEFYFIINYNFDLTTYNPYYLTSANVETDNFQYTPCSVVGYDFPDIYNVKYRVICQVNKPLTNWNINFNLGFSTGDYPLISNNDRARFLISTGSNGMIVKDATNQDVVNNIINQTNQIINNNNQNTQQIVTKIDTTHGILRTISSAITSVINAITNIPSLVFNAFSTILNNIYNAFTTIFDYFDDILSNDVPTMQYISDYLDDLPGYEDNIIIQIISIPVHIWNSIINSNSCSSITLGSLFGTTLTIPCLRSSLSSILGPIYTILIGIIEFYIYYVLLIKIRDTLQKVGTLEYHAMDDFKINF